MLVIFRSTATESITLFSGVAQQLLKLMGASGRIPGALNPEDVPTALARLESAVEDLRHQRRGQPPVPAADNGSPPDAGPMREDADREPVVEITTRAVPLISLLRKAAAARAEIMWEARSR